MKSQIRKNLAEEVVVILIENAKKKVEVVVEAQVLILKGAKEEIKTIKKLNNKVEEGQDQIAVVLLEVIDSNSKQIFMMLY